MKKITFKIVASVFTLMAQIVYEKRSYDVVRLQVLSNLVTASALNYALVSPLNNFIRASDYHFGSF